MRPYRGTPFQSGTASGHRNPAGASPPGAVWYTGRDVGTLDHRRGRAPARAAMTLDVAEAVVIERPVDVVAGFAGDPLNAPRWWRHAASAEWRTDPPTMLGSQVLIRGHRFRRPTAALWELTEYTPGEQIAMRTTAGAFPRTRVLTWRPVGARVTHMTMRVRAVPTRWWRPVTPVLARHARRAARRELAALARLLERS